MQGSGVPGVVMAIAVSIVLPACGADSVPVPTAPSSQSPPAPVQTKHRLSGVVRAATGSPIGGARIEFFHVPPAGSGLVSTTADSNGRYEISFEPLRPSNWLGLDDHLGTVRSWMSGFEEDFQLLPWGSTDIVQDLRLHPMMTVSAGQSFTITLEPDNAMCTDQEDWYVPGRRCRTFRVLAGIAGTLTVEARPDNGGPVPYLFSATSGWYERQTPDLGAVSLLKVRAGERYQIFAGVPYGTPTHQYSVSTSVRPD